MESSGIRRGQEVGELEASCEFCFGGMVVFCGGRGAVGVLKEDEPGGVEECRVRSLHRAERAGRANKAEMR